MVAYVMSLFVYVCCTVQQQTELEKVFLTQFHYKYCVCKGKAVPLQAWSGSKVSRKLRFPDFMTTAKDGGKVVSLTHRPPLPSGNTPGTYFC